MATNFFRSEVVPDRTQMIGLGVFLLLALGLAGWGPKALRSKISPGKQVTSPVSRASAGIEINSPAC